MDESGEEMVGLVKLCKNLNNEQEEHNLLDSTTAKFKTDERCSTTTNSKLINSRSKYSSCSSSSYSNLSTSPSPISSLINLESFESQNEQNFHDFISVEPLDKLNCKKDLNLNAKCTMNKALEKNNSNSLNMFNRKSKFDTSYKNEKTSKIENFYEEESLIADSNGGSDLFFGKFYLTGHLT